MVEEKLSYKTTLTRGRLEEKSCCGKSGRSAIFIRDLRTHMYMIHIMRVGEYRRGGNHGEVIDVS